MQVPGRHTKSEAPDERSAHLCAGRGAQLAHHGGTGGHDEGNAGGRPGDESSRALVSNSLPGSTELRPQGRGRVRASGETPRGRDSPKFAKQLAAGYGRPVRRQALPGAPNERVPLRGGQADRLDVPETAAELEQERGVLQEGEHAGRGVAQVRRHSRDQFPRGEGSRGVPKEGLDPVEQQGPIAGNRIDMRDAELLEPHDIRPAAEQILEQVLVEGRMAEPTGRQLGGQALRRDDVAPGLEPVHAPLDGFVQLRGRQGQGRLVDHRAMTAPQDAVPRAHIRGAGELLDGSGRQPQVRNRPPQPLGLRAEILDRHGASRQPHPLGQMLAGVDVPGDSEGRAHPEFEDRREEPLDRWAIEIEAGRIDGESTRLAQFDPAWAGRADATPQRLEPAREPQHADRAQVLVAPDSPIALACHEQGKMNAPEVRFAEELADCVAVDQTAGAFPFLEERSDQLLRQGP